MSIPRLHASMSPVAQATLSSELLVLLPSLGTGTELWDGVVAELAFSNPSLRILRVDLPGHGASPPAQDAFTVADLARAVLRLVDEVGGGSFFVAGVSLGGAVALELALLAPERVRSLGMICSGARLGEPSAWNERAAQVRASGTASLATRSAGRWFAPGYLRDAPNGPGARLLSRLLDVDDESYATCCEALAAFDATAELGSLALPTLLVSGEHDAVTTPETMRELAERIPGARYADIAGASHLAVIERPSEAAALLRTLIDRAAAIRPSTDASAGEAREVGVAVRRAVLGDAHVDAAEAAVTPETADFQDFLTRYAWGEVWSRPGISRRERSIATLAVLVADGHLHEVRMHVHAALRNGLSREEIAEVVLHVALYAGLPASNAAFAVVKDVFAETPRLHDDFSAAMAQRTQGELDG